MLPSFGIADMVSAKRLWFSPKLSNNHNNVDRLLLKFNRGQ